MSRRALYWLLQFAGWGLVFIFNLPFMVMRGSTFTLTDSAITMALCAISGLLITHWWRGHLKRKHYVEMPLKSSVGPYLCWVFILGCLLTFLAGIWYRLFLVPNTFRRADWIPSALSFWTLTIAVWTGIYVTVTSLRRATELEKQRLQSDVLAKDARLQVLRQQLNPHFLFNSLNGLRALIFEDAEKAGQMVDRLAALLRYSLQSGSNELVTLEEELVMVNEYLSIERIRFEERLQVVTDVPAGVLESMLPRMLLQTLVENAVKHGIEPSVAGGSVSISAAMQNGDLRLIVKNPGTLTLDSSSTRVGLNNAEQRLALLIGSRASLQMRQVASDVEAVAVIPQ